MCIRDRVGGAHDLAHDGDAAGAGAATGVGDRGIDAAEGVDREGCGADQGRLLLDVVDEVAQALEPEGRAVARFGRRRKDRRDRHVIKTALDGGEHVRERVARAADDAGSLSPRDELILRGEVNTCLLYTSDAADE